MSDTSIIVDTIGKRYRLGGAEANDSLRSRLGQLVRRTKAKPDDSFWALDEISFSAKQGETIGIIGRNGAGKSTLLKVLSRITSPTRGRVEIHGRVGCLLEVGTGFHPELSGRDNVFLNGTILGMKRSEIRRHFDEIVAFAEVEKFIDTPVKHYSSGMYLRLAFAVAAHLQPEILIVDEVLAVGDARFQKKCLDKMEDVSRHGRTVLFVSHNMPSVTRLCPRTILLDKGRVLADGPSHDVVSAYLRGGLGTTAERTWATDRPGNEIANLHAARVVDESGAPRDAMDIRKRIGIQIEYEVTKSGHVLVPNFHCFNEEGACVFVAVDTSTEGQHCPKEPGIYSTVAWIPANFLSEGTIVVNIALSTMDPVVVHFHERDAVAFQVVDSLTGDSARGVYAGPMPGVVRPMLDWATTRAVRDR
ncbi:MAG TPA: ABC transporter ATP-binding protein [Polyangiaceae bacterium]|jgi:lipopolysaccharide transport system ATP-binding protein|nr:ABC transporter ATP-binding protein [Polyangiaceae bacterium]